MLGSHLSRFLRRTALCTGLVLAGATSAGTAAILDAAPAQAQSCTDSWTGAAGTNAWSTPGNWSQDAIPTSTSVACIGDQSSGTPFSVSVISTVPVGSLIVGGVTPSTLTLSSAIIEFASGASEVTSNGIIDVAATAGEAWLDVGGGLTLTVDSGGQINTSGSGGIAYLGSSGGTIVNNGIINADAVTTDVYDGVTVTNNSAFTVGSGGTVNQTGTFTNAAGGSVANSGTFSVGGTFVARGTEAGSAVTIDGAVLDDDTSAGALGRLSELGHSISLVVVPALGSPRPRP